MMDNDNVQNKLEKLLIQVQKLGIHVANHDFTRPWGGFLVIDSVDTNKFIQQFYSEMADELQNSSLPLSPKILCVAPGKRLSWQYHNRRAELWKLIEGKAAYRKSDTDEETDIEIMEMGKTLTLRQGERHRLIGLNEWGIIAEIWQHTDTNHPSDEDDIIRVQDDFNRESN